MINQGFIFRKIQAQVTKKKLGKKDIMIYSETVMDHFEHPRNLGVID